MSVNFSPASVWPGIAGSRIVIVGGSSGIGLGAAELFARLEAEVIIASRDPERPRNPATRHPGIATEAVDGRSPESVGDLFARVGAFDHLIITLAGKLGGGLFAETPISELRQAFDEKFWPHLTIAKAALPTLRKTGSLTFVTGASARKVSPGGTGFAAMNGALEIMTPTIARELAPLRVNAVSPGFVVTPWYEHLPDAEMKGAIEFASARLPVGRVGQPEDIAQALLYVVGNGFVTGSVIECDGGARVSNDTPETGLPK